VTALAAPRSDFARLWRVACASALALGLGGCLGSGLSDLTGAAASLSPFSAPGQARRAPLLVASTHNGARVGAATFSEIVATVPPGHSPGLIERPVVTPESASRHFTLGPAKPLSDSAFQMEASRLLSGRTGLGRDVLVYVHGYNTAFDEAAYRITQIVADTGFSGVPVLFAWPSRNSLFGYGADKEGATASRDALEKLLRDLGRNPDVGRVHVLAHSMGTWLAMEALRQAAIGGDGSLGGKIGSVMLAAPDLDLDVFRVQVARIGRADNISLFVASDDRALMLSSRLAGSRARVGGLDLTNKQQREEVTSLGVRVYDLTGARDGGDYFRHGTFAEAPQIVQVIGTRLKDAKVVEASAAAAPAIPQPGPVSAPAVVAHEELAPLPQPTAAPSPSAQAPTGPVTQAATQ